MTGSLALTFSGAQGANKASDFSFFLSLFFGFLFSLIDMGFSGFKMGGAGCG